MYKTVTTCKYENGGWPAYANNMCQMNDSLIGKVN